MSNKKEDKIKNQFSKKVCRSKKRRMIADDIIATEPNASSKSEAVIENKHHMILRSSKGSKITDNINKFTDSNLTAKEEDEIKDKQQINPQSIKKSILTTDDIKMTKSNITNEKEYDQKYHICTKKCSSTEDLIGEFAKWFCHLVSKYLDKRNSDIKPRSPTPADGNCFYHAVIDQIHLLSIQEVPKCNKQLRHSVCAHLSNLPEEMKNNIREVYGEDGLEKFAEQHSQNGECAVHLMIQATAHYLNRNIIIYAPDGDTITQTKIEGGDGSDAKQPITVFYSSKYKHYQSIYIKNVGSN